MRFLTDFCELKEKVEKMCIAKKCFIRPLGFLVFDPKSGYFGLFLFMWFGLVDFCTKFWECERFAQHTAMVAVSKKSKIVIFQNPKMAKSRKSTKIVENRKFDQNRPKFDRNLTIFWPKIEGFDGFDEIRKVAKSAEVGNAAFKAFFDRKMARFWPFLTVLTGPASLWAEPEAENRQKSLKNRSKMPKIDENAKNRSKNLTKTLKNRILTIFRDLGPGGIALFCRKSSKIAILTKNGRKSSKIVKIGKIERSEIDQNRRKSDFWPEIWPKFRGFWGSENGQNRSKSPNPAKCRFEGVFWPQNGSKNDQKWPKIDENGKIRSARGRFGAKKWPKMTKNDQKWSKIDDFWRSKNLTKIWAQFRALAKIVNFRFWAWFWLDQKAHGLAVFDPKGSKPKSQNPGSGQMAKFRLQKWVKKWRFLMIFIDFWSIFDDFLTVFRPVFERFCSERVGHRFIFRPIFAKMRRYDVAPPNADFSRREKLVALGRSGRPLVAKFCENFLG